MIQFVCDSCARTKAPNELWILGLAAEAVGVTAARREVTILSGWTRDNALHPLAIHFCSEECKDDYMEKLFAEPETEELIEETVVRGTPSRRRRQRIKQSSGRTARRKKRAA